MEKEYEEYLNWMKEYKKLKNKGKYPLTSSSTDFLLNCILNELKKISQDKG